MRFLASLLLAAALQSQSPPEVQQSQAWVEKSNRNARLLLNVVARYAPEAGVSLGISGLDDKITIPAIDSAARSRRDTSEAIRVLQSRLATEPDPLVKQDLQILIASAERDNRESAAKEKYMLPYENVGGDIYFGMQTLLDDQIAPARRKAAVTRLRRYTGLEAGYTPTTQLSEAIFRERLKTPGLLGPAKAEVEQDLTNTDAYITGIGLLLEKYKMTGYADPYTKMKEQLTQYKDFVRSEVLPKARTDFRLPQSSMPSGSRTSESITARKILPLSRIVPSPKSRARCSP